MISTKQLSGFAATLGFWARRGFPLLSDEQAERRLMACRRCAEYDINREVCHQCGCHMPLKARLGTARCPLNRWPDMNLTEGASQ